MSRCFPFPPPGYERKHTPDNLDLLKEAKRKEKKHKKEKKDKGRKKDKEKEKDGSDEKHRDKKDQKEKHRDKKEKHKGRKKDEEDRVKDKDKSSISEELTVAGKPEDRNGGKLQPKVHSKDRSGFIDAGKSSILVKCQNGGKPSLGCLPLSNEESKFVQELGRRIRDDQRGSGSQFLDRVAVVDNKDQEMVPTGAVRNSSSLLVDERFANSNKIIDGKIDPRGVKNDLRASKIAQNLMPVTKAKVEGVGKQVDGQNGRRLEYREKYKETDVKQRYVVKDSLTKEQEKMKDENAKIRNGNKSGSQNQFKDDRSNDSGGSTYKKSVDMLKEAKINAANEENIRKRKEYTNGFLHESEIRPNKMQRPGPHKLIESTKGRKPEPFQTPTNPSHDKQAVSNSSSVDNRERLMNGLIDSHKPSPTKPKPSAASVASAETSKVPGHDSHSANRALKVPNIEDIIAEALRRPPHPDSKYLAEVLTVPNMDWSELDDQEWLFSTDVPVRKHNMEAVGELKDQHVWSEAVHIESADVYALPYVIPY